MKKIKLLLASVLLIMCNMNGQAQVAGNSDLSNEKVYTVTTERGAWCVDQTNNRMNYNGSYTTSDATPTDDVNYQFAFINHEGHYYLYAPAVKKFVQPQKYFVTGYSTPVTLAVEDGNIKVKAETSDLTMNIGGNQWTWDTWTSYDGGNKVTIVEAADFSASDLNEAISILTDATHFDQHKVYTIACERVGNWAVSADHNNLSSTTAYSGATAEEKQFAFYYEEGKLYIYSVGAGKFLKGDGTLANGTLGDPMDYRIVGTSGYDHMLFVPSTNCYFNSQNGGGYAINTWSTPDAGNKQQIVEVEDVDVFDAMDAIVHPSYFVTYVVKDAANNTLFTSEPLATTLGTAITTLPAEFQRAFYTYNEVNKVISEQNTTVEFTATWNGPFEISADFATAHWYDMAMRNTWYVTSGVKDGDGAYKTQNANTMGLVEDAYQWAFIGNGYDGFKIINKAEGNGKSFGWTDATATNQGIPTIMDDSEGHHGWKIVASTSSSVPAGSFCLNVPGTNLYINQYGGAGGSVKFWDSGNNVGDAGSAFTVFDVPTNFKDFVVDEIAPIMEATGYFAFTDDAKATIGYDESYKTECSFQQYKSMKENLAAISGPGDIKNYVLLPGTGCYILKNKNYGTYMGIDPSDKYLYGNYESVNNLKHIVTLTRSNDDKYSLRIVGAYAPANVEQSKQVIAGTEEAFYTVSVPTVGYAAFQADPANNMSVLHCAAGGSIVGWEAPAEASQWEVIDAAGSKVEIALHQVGEEYYATLCVPFAYTVAGAKAYTLTLEGDKLIPTEVTNVPAGTPVLVQGTNASATITIVGTNFAAEPLYPSNDNVLTGTYSEIEVDGDADYFLGKKYLDYVGEGEDHVGFYHWSGTKLGANRAYLAASTIGAGVKGFVIDFGGEVGIRGIDQVLNGQAIYDLGGRKVQGAAQRGIYVVGGKKMVIK